MFGSMFVSLESQINQTKNDKKTVDSVHSVHDDHNYFVRDDNECCRHYQIPAAHNATY